MSKYTLPFVKSSANGEFIVVQGGGGEFRKVPLHWVDLVMEIISRSVMVGVMSTLSAKSVSVLLKNDLAGRKVIAEPKIVMKLVTSDWEDWKGDFWRDSLAGWFEPRPVRW